MGVHLEGKLPTANWEQIKIILSSSLSTPFVKIYVSGCKQGQHIILYLTFFVLSIALDSGILFSKEQNVKLIDKLELFLSEVKIAKTDEK